MISSETKDYAANLVQRLASVGIVVEVNDGKIQIVKGKDKLTPAMIARLKQYAGEIRALHREYENELTEERKAIVDADR